MARETTVAGMQVQDAEIATMQVQEHIRNTQKVGSITKMPE